MSSERIFHGDLHIRQIMIVSRNINNCEPVMKAVIGDFGEHVIIDSPTTHLSDLKVFFKSLLEVIEHVESSQLFTLKISKCLSFISQKITNIELHDLSYDINEDILQIKNFCI